MTKLIRSLLAAAMIIFTTIILSGCSSTQTAPSTPAQSIPAISPGAGQSTSPTQSTAIVTTTPVPNSTSAPTQTPGQNTMPMPVSTPPAPTVSSTTPSTPSIPPAPSTPGQTVTIDLVAQNIAFDQSTISVPAGANVVVNFNNKDSGIPHNFSVYQNLAGGQVKAIFIGATIVGPSTITYRFTAPSAGNSYFFECDVHPTAMTGSFVVTAN